MTDVGDEVMVRLQEKRAKLIKQRAKLDRWIDDLDRRIADQPERIRRYLAAKQTTDPDDKWMAQFMWDPRRLTPGKR